MGLQVAAKRGSGRDANACPKEELERSPEGKGMTKFEAHIVLNQVRDGVLHPESVVIAALCLTGDIYAKCPNLESDTSTGTDDRTHPYPLHSALQND